MNIRLITRLLMFSLFLMPFAVHAYDCTDVPHYISPPPVLIKSGDVYQNVNQAFRCEVGGWCNSAPWAFEPGVGAFWNQAWSALGDCNVASNQAPEIDAVFARFDAYNQIDLPTDEGFVKNKKYLFNAYLFDANGNLTHWELSAIYLTGDVAGEPVVISSGTSELGEYDVQVSGSWTPAANGVYLIGMKAVDSDGEIVTESFTIGVNNFSKPLISLSSPTVLLVSEMSGVSATAWHPIMRPQDPSIKFSHPVSDLHSSPSSSSGGVGIGFDAYKNYSWSPAQTGTYTITASSGDYSISKKTEVLPDDGLPALRITGRTEADIGDLAIIDVTALDRHEITGVTFYRNGVLQEPSTSVTRGTNTIWGYDNSYMIFVNGREVLEISATDNEGNIQTVEHIIEVETSGDCAALGIDPTTVNEYPNWPRLDWKGDPNNAVNGDLMQHLGRVYKALWWTQSVPGSDDSWEFLCEI